MCVFNSYVGDTGLLDYTIKVLVNRELCGFYMKRETDSVTGKLLYYAAAVDGANLPSKQHTQMEKENNAPVSETSSEAVLAESQSKYEPEEQRTGKRKVGAPKRFEDYMKPIKKRASGGHGGHSAPQAAVATPRQPFAQEHLPAPPPPLPPALGVTANKMIFNNINSCIFAETVGLSQDLNTLREQLKQIPCQL